MSIHTGRGEGGHFWMSQLWRLPCQYLPDNCIFSDWRHPEVIRYAIVDDIDDFLPKQRRYFVHTSYDQGLLDKHVKRLAAILGNIED
jgi:hypothetical protein